MMVRTQKKVAGVAGLVLAVGIGGGAVVATADALHHHHTTSNQFNYVMPSSKLTPGEIIPGVTTAQVCSKGWAGDHRNVTTATKMAVFASYGVDYKLHAQYEVDHLISLELGGDNAQANLWPQPQTENNAHSGNPDKDLLEGHLHNLVCAGKVPLAQAQHDIATNWLTAWTKYEPMK